MDRDRRTRIGARAAGSTKDEGKLIDARVASHGKALSDQPALKPYWGKPAVRNFREGNGNVGIMRSPLRAIALPDTSTGKFVLTHTRAAADPIPNAKKTGVAFSPQRVIPPRTFDGVLLLTYTLRPHFASA